MSKDGETQTRTDERLKQCSENARKDSTGMLPQYQLHSRPSLTCSKDRGRLKITKGYFGKQKAHQCQ